MEVDEVDMEVDDRLSVSELTDGCPLSLHDRCVVFCDYKTFPLEYLTITDDMVACVPCSQVFNKPVEFFCDPSTPQPLRYLYQHFGGETHKLLTEVKVRAGVAADNVAITPLYMRRVLPILHAFEQSVRNEFGADDDAEYTIDYKESSVMCLTCISR